jgi:hypothetical protein
LDKILSEKQQPQRQAQRKATQQNQTVAGTKTPQEMTAAGGRKRGHNEIDPDAEEDTIEIDK